MKIHNKGSLLCLAFLATMPQYLVAGMEEEKVPKPCCFPSAFQATVADMRSAAKGDVVRISVMF